MADDDNLEIGGENIKGIKVLEFNNYRDFVSRLRLEIL